MGLLYFREDAVKIRLPKSMEDAKSLATVLSNFKDDYFFSVVLAFFYVYVLYPFFVICMLLAQSTFLPSVVGFLVMLLIKIIKLFLYWLSQQKK